MGPKHRGGAQAHLAQPLCWVTGFHSSVPCIRPDQSLSMMSWLETQANSKGERRLRMPQGLTSVSRSSISSMSCPSRWSACLTASRLSSVKFSTAMASYTSQEWSISNARSALIQDSDSVNCCVFRPADKANIGVQSSWHEPGHLGMQSESCDHWPWTPRNEAITCKIWNQLIVRMLLWNSRTCNMLCYTVWEQYGQSGNGCVTDTHM